MRILVIHATAGAGHMKAAEALYKGIQKYTDHNVQFLDALDKCPSIFRKFYPVTYEFMVKHAPAVWGFFFWLLDLPGIQPLLRVGRRLYNEINTQGLKKYLIQEQFDVIISTQFLSVEVCAALKRSGKIKSKVITVVTDFDVHRIWLSQGVDLYTCASQWTQEKLHALGVSKGCAHVTGIPTDEKFYAQKDILQLKKKLGLKEDMFTVLIATGGFGMGPIEEIAKRLKGFQVLVVAGYNKNLLESLNQANYPDVIPYGFVDNMHELMAVADCMVTKPGGLSISESLISQIPLIFFSAIPGQEANNIKVLRKYDIGFLSSHVDDIVGKLNEYKTSKDTYLQAVKQTKRLASPNAVNDIIKLI